MSRCEDTLGGQRGMETSVPDLDWTQAFRLAFNHTNGMARIDAIAWSKEDKVISFRHFTVQWTVVWLDYDRDELFDIFVESNGIPGGVDPKIIWES